MLISFCRKHYYHQYRKLIWEILWQVINIYYKTFSGRWNVQYVRYYNNVFQKPIGLGYYNNIIHETKRLKILNKYSIEKTELIATKERNIFRNLILKPRYYSNKLTTGVSLDSLMLSGYSNYSNGQIWKYFSKSKQIHITKEN